jgi:cell division protein FtsN
MTRTDGEHELVLGNKQLLSAFFVVVVLLGVFFTMGYFVGKNTATAGFNSGSSAASGGDRPDPAGKPLDSGTPASSAPPPDSTTAATDPHSSAPAAPETSAPSTPVAPPVDTKPETKPAAPPTDRPSAEAAPADKEAMAEPSSEQKYLQVSAVRRPDADNMVKVLRERGFPALLGESSKQGLYRVLVGPFKTTTELGHAKADLKAKGFDSIVAK